MRHRAGEACLAAVVVFIFFGVIDANIRTNEVVFDPNTGTPLGMRVIPISPSSSACDAAANRPAFCSGLRPGSPPTERFSTR
jgi:hypothetical protein